ncbi:MAG: redoxin family protein, partial [Nitrosotalea sp.]
VMGFSYAYADTMQENNSMHDKMMMGNHMSNDSMMMHDKNMADNSMMKQNMMMNTPVYQIKHGVSMHDVKCVTGFSLIFKSSDDSPACVKPSSVSMLVARGWAQGDAMGMMDKSMAGMKDSMNSHDMMNQTMGTNDHMMDKSMMNGSNMMNHTMSNDTMKENSIPLEKQSDTSMAKMDKTQFKKVPGLIGITDYINTTPDDLQKAMKGKVVLYDFWTFNCINCIHTIPSLNQLNAKYADKGLLIIGIHSPETPTEKDPNNVRNAVEKDGIKYPVVLDTNFETWNAFGNHYWPRQYIADTDGYIRYDNIGEGNYDGIENEIQSLLAENKNT